MMRCMEDEFKDIVGLRYALYNRYLQKGYIFFVFMKHPGENNFFIASSVQNNFCFHIIFHIVLVLRIFFFMS